MECNIEIGNAAGAVVEGNTTKMTVEIVINKTASILGQTGADALLLAVKVLNSVREPVKAIIVAEISKIHNNVAYNHV